MREIDRVLAATDGSEHGRNAVVTAAARALRIGARLDVVSVFDLHGLPLGIEAATHEDTLLVETRRDAEAQAREAGAYEATVHARAGLPAPSVATLAGELNVDLLVLGAHPRPAVARFLVGSTAERIIRLANLPALVATEARREPYRRVLAAVDLSRHSLAVMDVAATLARDDQAELRALFVEDRLSPMLLEAALFDQKETRHHAREQFERLLAGVSRPSELLITPEIREGHAGREILTVAGEWKADLILVGSHGFGFFNRLLLGSTSVYVLRHGHLDVLVVPRNEGGD